MAVYTNDLRLKEIANGDESGTWGTSTNLNLKLIGEALSFQTEAIFDSDGDKTTTVADGAEDAARGLFYKATSTTNLTATRVLTIAPATISRVMFIENATSGSQSITVRQSAGGTNVTIPNGQTKAVYLDGADTNPNVVDAFQDLSIPDLFIDDDLTFTSDSAVITFGADGDTTLTHTDGSGLTLNSTNKLMFNDASQFIQGSSATVLSLGATDEIDLTATAIDINGTVDMSSTLTVGGNVTINSTTLTLSGNFPQLFFEDTHGSDLDSYIVNNANGLFIGKTNSPSSSNDIVSIDLSTKKVTFDAGIVVNESGGDNNTRFEGDSNTSLFEIDASTDRIGIGTSAPSEQLTIQNANDAVVLIESSGSDATDDARLEIKTTNGTFTIQNDRSLGTSGALTFAGNTSNNIVIDHNAGNVGFNKSNPSMGIDLVAANNSQLRIDSSDTNDTTLFLDYNGGGATNRIRLRNAAGAFAVNVDNTIEAMRVDSSGNLMLGKTSSSTLTAGVEARQDGTLAAVKDGGGAAVFGRLTDDGTIVTLRKDTSNIGSIAIASDGVHFNGDGLGLRMSGTAITPSNGSTGTEDATNDLGTSAVRFKDIHLSGTANTGLLEVASANTTLANFQANVGGAGGVGVVNIKTNTSSSNGLQLVGNGSGASIAGGSLAATVQNTENGPLRFGTNASERARITEDGDFLVGSTTVTQLTSAALTFDVSQGRLVVTADGGTTEPLILNRHDSDGTLVEFRQANTVEGTISVSGSTVSYNGFSGSHDSSGIPSDTELGTVCSTIDELDTYPDTRKDLNGNDEDHPKKGQTRPDHPKIKVSDSVGDARVYGVLGGFQKDGKPVVVSVGIGSVRVTGSCSGGDLLESNGDGTAKVQSDDIIRSKTIGKVTIGNSSSSVKLVSCVLYCG